MKLTLPELVASEPLNFCCPSAFFAANRYVAGNILAARLGLTDRTTKEWKAKWTHNLLDCTQTSTCVLETCPKHLLRKLAVRLKSSRGLAMAAGQQMDLKLSTSGEK